MNEEQAIQEMKDLEREAIYNVCGILVGYNMLFRENLERVVASLCDVPVVSMLFDTTRIDYVRARWLYWYAYRYMTDESLERIGKLHNTVEFSGCAVGRAISKMAMLIGGDTIWTKRWIILKRFIKAILKNEDAINNTVTVKVAAPKGINVELKQE